MAVSGEFIEQALVWLEVPDNGDVTTVKAHLLADASKDPARTIQDLYPVAGDTSGIVRWPQGQVVAETTVGYNTEAAIVIPQHQFAREWRITLRPVVQHCFLSQQKEGASICGYDLHGE